MRNNKDDVGMVDRSQIFFSSQTEDKKNKKSTRSEIRPLKQDTDTDLGSHVAAGMEEKEWT